MASGFHSDENERICNTLILGDSITNILSRKKTCGPNLQIKIKSPTGAILRNIHNTIIYMAENDDGLLSNVGAVLIRWGTNNLSDGDTTDTVLEH